MLGSLILAAVLSQSCPGGTCARPAVAVAYAPPDGAAVFLSALNAERARHRRGPLRWDATLAWYASRNTAVHAPASIPPGCSQCWASTPSYTVAYRLWMASPPHRSILLNARWSVGVARCPTGLTANAR